EFGEHIELGIENLHLVQVVTVLTHPPEGAPRSHLQPTDIDAAILEKPQIRLRKVLADHHDQPHLDEEARRVGEINRRAAEHLLHLAKQRLDAVQDNRTYHQQINHIVVHSSKTIRIRLRSTYRAEARAASASQVETPSD